MSSTHHLKADLILVLTTLLAGFGWIFSKFALLGLSPLFFIGLRFSIAALILLPLGGYRQLCQLQVEQWRLGILGGSLFAIAMVFWVTGLNLATHVGVGAFLASLGIVLVPVIGLFFGERPPVSAWFSLPLVIVGLACLSLDKEFHIGPGELCFLVAASLLAFSFIFISRASAAMPTIAVTVLQLALTGLLALSLSMFVEHWKLSLPLNIWLWFAASVLIATCMRFLMQAHAQGMAPASHSAIILTLEPVWTALFAYLFLNERMTALQLLGCSLILIAMLVNRWPQLKMVLFTAKSNS